MNEARQHFTMPRVVAMGAAVAAVILGPAAADRVTNGTVADAIGIGSQQPEPAQAKPPVSDCAKILGGRFAVSPGDPSIVSKISDGRRIYTIHASSIEQKATCTQTSGKIVLKEQACVGPTDYQSSTMEARSAEVFMRGSSEIQQKSAAARTVSNCAKFLLGKASEHRKNK